MINYTFSNAKYIANEAGENTVIEVTIDGKQTSHVPVNPDNVHFQAIQKWVAEGNTIAEAE
tara:strand:- start:92 stop:274 length:183 start_codon:yes stop_codon:yes gene_type:complete